jgi:tRNA (guanine-N7-)-methyltransferase
VESTRRAARSFQPRRRGLPPARHAEYQERLARWSLDPDGDVLRWNETFGSTSADQRVVLDIGFGGGEGLIELAAARPYEAVIGVEVHTPGVARVLEAIEVNGWRHVRVVEADVLDFQHRLAPASLSGIRLWFPDPWLKNKQKHRRLVRPEVIVQWRQLLRVGGELHVATDIDDYVSHTQRVLAGAEGFQGGIVPRPDWRPRTRFEERGHREGRTATDLVYARIS